MNMSKKNSFHSMMSKNRCGIKILFYFILYLYFDLQNANNKLYEMFCKLKINIEKRAIYLKCITKRGISNKFNKIRSIKKSFHN